MAETAEIREARRALGRQLAGFRQAAGYNQYQFAPLTHYGRSTIANVEVGRQNVPRSFWERADLALAASGSLAAQYDDLALLVQQHRRELARSRAVKRPITNEEGSGSSPGLAVYDDGSAAITSIEAVVAALGRTEARPVGFGEPEASPVPTRRELLGYFGAALAAVGLEQFPDVQQAKRPRVVEALEVTGQAQSSGIEELDGLLSIVGHYRQTFRSTPPAALYNELLGVRAYASTLINNAHAASNRLDLLVATGWLSNLLALVTHDLNDRAAALVWCADAERHSRKAGHPELAGWAAQTRVLMSFYDGHSGEAVAHAQRGQHLVPLGSVVHAKLLAQEMRAWALLGKPEKVSSTRRRAEKAIAALPSRMPPRGAFSISLADDPPYTATSLLLLGRNKEAAEATRRVISTFYGSTGGDGRGEHPSGFACTHLILALALTRLGELDEAYRAGCMAVAAPRLIWSVDRLAGKLDRALTHGFADTFEARDYHERYVALVQQRSAQDRLTRSDPSFS